MARLPGYRSDSGAGVDLLGRQGEAVAIADLVTARSARPPLAVGVFGQWGEGKSQFLDLVETAVLARATRVGPGDAVTHSAVRQVRFNAWHYAEADLWASLVAELFAQLGRDTWPAWIATLTPKPPQQPGPWQHPLEGAITPTRAQRGTRLVTADLNLHDQATAAGLPLPERLTHWGPWDIPVGRLSFPTGPSVIHLASNDHSELRPENSKRRTRQQRAENDPLQQLS